MQNNEREELDKIWDDIDKGKAVTYEAEEFFDMLNNNI
tara:strand:- start:121 stop:234 length:114 start_codon:yes stop_codon:yes gene_type:complete